MGGRLRVSGMRIPRPESYATWPVATWLRTSSGASHPEVAGEGGMMLQPATPEGAEGARGMYARHPPLNRGTFVLEHLSQY